MKRIIMMLILVFAVISYAEGSSRCRVIAIEGNTIIFEIGTERVIDDGDEYKVVDENNKEIGLVEVVSLRGIEGTAKIIRGKGDIKEGDFLVYRPKLTRNWTISRKSFPVEIRVNPLYEQVTGKTSDIPSDDGYAIILSGSRRGISVGTGVISLGGVLSSWNIIDLNIGLRQSIIRDYIDIGFNIGCGATHAGYMDWARDPNIQCENLDVASGENAGLALYFDTSAAIHLFPVRSLSLSFGAGYYTFLAFTDFDEYYDEETEKTYKIDKDWLQYHCESIGGLMFEFGIHYWFENEDCFLSNYF